MNIQIQELEQSALRLEPEENERKELLSRIIEYSENFLNNLHRLPAYKMTETKGIELYDYPFSDDPADINQILELLRNNVDTPGLNPASGGHLGYIPGGGIYYSALGDFLADITNRYAGVFFASPGAVRMENMLLNWMSELVGYPAASGGNLTSGGSIANLTAIVTARDAAGLKAKDFERSVVYLSEQVHHSVEKALRIAGLGECIKRIIPLDENFRMIPDSLEQAILSDKKNGLYPWLIVTSAGTTDLGVIDPLIQISQIASSYKIWLHVDAAYGGFFMLCESGKNKLKGIENSDSLIMDPHKGLFIPYGSGAVLVKDKLKMLESHHYSANYMQDALKSQDELASADLSPELSKHFRGLRLWLPLKLLGIKPFRNALEEKIRLARYFYETVSEFQGFELGPYPDLSIVSFRYRPENGNQNEFNKKLVDEIQRDGRVFLSSTVIDQKYTLRLAVLSFRTHKETIDQTIAILKEKIDILKK
ncbi:MAG: pyridoxal phosphate-dependent decarboxylase family protein [Bacillota bacterium]